MPSTSGEGTHTGGDVVGEYRLGHPGGVVPVVLGGRVGGRPGDLRDRGDDALDAEPGELPLRGEAEVAALVGRERRPGEPSIHLAISPQGLPGNLLVTASPVSASRAQTVVDLRWTSIPNAVEYFGMGASQPRCGAAAPMALQHHCRSPDPRSRAGAPVFLVPSDWVIVSVRPLSAVLPWLALRDVPFLPALGDSPCRVTGSHWGRY